MHKTPIAEWLLARITDPMRAAAIMGDLVEISATRGRVWFWTAYARTLVSLGWRIPVGFVIAIACVWFSGHIIVWLSHHLIHGRMNNDGLFGGYNWDNRIGPFRIPMRLRIQALAVQYMTFSLAFSLVRFGRRNRLTQLTCALLLIALPIISMRPVLMDISTIFCVLAIAVALLLPLWRRPLIVLAATCLTAIAPVEANVIALVFYQKHMSAFQNIACFYIGYALAVIVCVYLYRRLLQRPPASDRTLA
jgi:hypothetical protein